MSPLMMSLGVLVLLLGSSIFVQVTPALRVGAWNIQNLGQKKMNKSNIVDIIVKVMKAYDIIAILEIADMYNVTPPKLLAKLNEVTANDYNLTLSDRVGITSHKEQYGFYWRQSRVTKVSVATASDGGKFIYTPFVVLAESVINSKLTKFGLVAIHTSPSKAVSEISALVDVYKSFMANTNVTDALIMGDFNAGCGYVNPSDWLTIPLRTDTKTFKWLLNDNDFTNVGSITPCPYDRIVAAGTNMLAISMTGKVLKYDTTMDPNLAKAVSDHYPVYVDIPTSKRKRHLIDPNISHSVTFPSTVELLEDFAQSKSHNCSCHDFVADGFTAKSIDEALASSKSKYILILPDEALEVLEHKVNKVGFQDPTQQDEGAAPVSYDVTLVCQMSKESCMLSLSARTFVNFH